MNRKQELPDMDAAVGDMIHGFSIKGITPLPDLRAIACEAVHVGSGARLLHILSDDPENLLALALRTPPSDDTGLPHILEHTVLCGSSRYPVKDPFVELLKRSLATFLNAMTYPDKTVYPCASMNKKDFFNLSGVYCDAVFHPLIREEHFKQEGHHFDFQEPGNIDSPLIIKGIVYNEMKGAYSDLDGIISRHTGRSICPDNTYGRDSGGDPDCIPDLTYDQFVRFHQTWYHPSNALIFHYGNIPVGELMAFLDSTCLNEFRKIEIDTGIAPQPRWTVPMEKTIPYPIGADEDTAEKTAAAVTFLTNDVTEAISTLSMHVLDYYLLGNAASPLRKALIDSKLGKELTTSGYADYQRDTFFTAGLKGTEPDRVDAIVKIILDTCAEQAEGGLDRDKLEAAFHRLELHSREIQGMYPLRLMDRVYRSWLYDADPLCNLRLNEHIAELRRRYMEEPDFFERKLQELIVENPHYTVLTFLPDRELSMRKEKAFREKMARIKKSMSREELDKIAEEAAELDALQTTPNPPEALATLPRLSLEDVPPDPFEMDTEVLEEGNVPFIYTNVFSNGLSYLHLAFDLRGIDDELIDYLPVYVDALSKMGAGDDDYAVMAEKEARSTGGIGVSVSVGGLVGDPQFFQPVFSVASRSLDHKLPEMLDVVFQRVVQCNLNDLERLRDVILQGQVARRSSLIPNGGHFAALYAARNLSVNSFTAERLGGITQIRLFDRLAGNFDSLCQDIVHKLTKIRDFMLSRNRLKVSFVGEEKHFGLAKDYISDIASGLPKSRPEERLPSFSPADIWREGLAAPADVAFVARAGKAVGTYHPLAPALLMLSSHLSYSYLWEAIRVKGGAYGARAQYDSLNAIFSFWSYRDPFIKETLDAFGGVSGYVENSMDLGAAGLEQAVIGTIKTLDQPIRPGQAVGLAMARHINRETPEFRKQFRSKLLSLKAEDVLNAVEEVIKPTLDSGATCILSSREKLVEANNKMAEDQQLEIEDI